MERIVAICFILILFTLSCSQSRDNAFRDRYRWISGKWEGDLNGVKAVEHWKWNKHRFEGEAYSIDSGDTISRERTFLVNYDGQVGYSVIVNGNGLCTFAEVESGDGIHRFENSDHDFPSIVEYALQGDSLITITLKAQSDVNADPISYRLKRVRR